MKTTPIWFRTIVMLALASMAVGCSSSSGKPNVIDAGSDSTGAGGGGASTDAGDARTDSGMADGHEAFTISP